MEYESEENESRNEITHPAGGVLYDKVRVKSSLRFMVSVFLEPYLEPAGNKRVLIIRGGMSKMRTGLEVSAHIYVLREHTC